MNDHDAMDEINAALDRYFAGNIQSPELLAIIAQISGHNRIFHSEAKKSP